MAEQNMSELGPNPTNAPLDADKAVTNGRGPGAFPALSKNVQSSMGTDALEAIAKGAADSANGDPMKGFVSAKDAEA